jgi:hypothetical protein
MGKRRWSTTNFDLMLSQGNNRQRMTEVLERVYEEMDQELGGDVLLSALRQELINQGLR